MISGAGFSNQQVDAEIEGLLADITWDFNQDKAAPAAVEG